MILHHKIVLSSRYFQIFLLVLVLEAAGYVLQIREPDWFEHRLFKGPDTDINLHVFSLGTSEIDRMLRFRDWLRTNDTDRDKYAQVKRSFYLLPQGRTLK